jgi:protein-S-isoprenylcysteine O-methyltransferase Ste14
MKRSRLTSIINKLLLVVACLFFYTVSFAQGGQDNADMMRSNGKIYVVVAVCLTILIGLFLYVLSVDRKISKIEKDN